METQIDTIPLSWALHSLSGIASPANASYSRAELEHQLKSSGSKALFTCLPLLPLAIQAAANSGIPKNRIYLLALPKEATGGLSSPPEYKTVDQLVQDGGKLPQLEKLQWQKGDGARKTAFLCYSSGTSGLPVCTSPYNNAMHTDSTQTERRHDFPQKRHIQRPANSSVRETLQRFSTRAWQQAWCDGSRAGSIATKPYILFGCYLSCDHLQR